MRSSIIAFFRIPPAFLSSIDDRMQLLQPLECLVPVRSDLVNFWRSIQEQRTVHQDLHNLLGKVNQGRIPPTMHRDKTLKALVRLLLKDSCHLARQLGLQAWREDIEDIAIIETCSHYMYYTYTADWSRKLVDGRRLRELLDRAILSVTPPKFRRLFIL